MLVEVDVELGKSSKNGDRQWGLINYRVSIFSGFYGAESDVRRNKHSIYPPIVSEPPRIRICI
jgi:hypothetical protein